MIVKLGSLISEYSVRNKADEDIPVYSVTNEQGFCTGYFSKEVASQDRTTYKIVPRGCFAYNPSRINVGSVDVQECEDRVIVSPLYVVFSVDEKLNRRYLLHYLKSDITLTYIKAYASGSVRDNLKFSILKDFPINLPSAEEQEQIVATLDGIEHLIALRKEELASLDELVKSRFIELFGTVTENPYGFPMATLKEVCHKITDGKHGGCEQEADSGYYYVGAREIYDDCIHYDTAPQITYADFAKDYKRCNIERGDMVIVNTGATIGKTAIASSPLTERTLLQKSVALLKVKTEIISAEFLRHCYMANPSMYRVESASAQPNLLLSRMNATRIYLPPIDLQEQFAAFVEQTDKSKLAVLKALEELEILKKSLMQQYFG